MIRGKIIGLRAVEIGDLELLRDWRNIEDFRRNFREVRELSMTDQEEWFKSISTNKANNFMFIIQDLASDQAIGAAGLLYINWIIRSADFSFYIGKDEQYIGNNEICNEAVQLLLDYGFNTLNLNKIWMELYDFDDRKIDFFTKNMNFNIDGQLRDNVFHKGRYWDSKIISLLRSECSY